MLATNEGGASVPLFYFCIMALLPWQKGIITRIEEETESTRRFWITVPELDSFSFKPGQFVTLDLPIHEKPNKRWRSYSIASWPDGSNTFELVIVKLEGGAGSSWIFEQGQVGQEVVFRGPQGVFILPETIETDLVFICTGTGIAPFRSMVHHIFNQHIPHRKLYLVFGTRKRADLLYFDELNALQKAHPSFEYHPVLSREDWEGHTGYVHTVYEQICADRQPTGFFLCGWRNMIDEAKKRITEMGYDRKAIHQELYG